MSRKYEEYLHCWCAVRNVQTIERLLGDIKKLDSPQAAKKMTAEEADLPAFRAREEAKARAEGRVFGATPPGKSPGKRVRR